MWLSVRTALARLVRTVLLARTRRVGPLSVAPAARVRIRTPVWHHALTALQVRVTTTLTQLQHVRRVRRDAPHRLDILASVERVPAVNTQMAQHVQIVLLASTMTTRTRAQCVWTVLLAKPLRHPSLLVRHATAALTLLQALLCAHHVRPGQRTPITQAQVLRLCVRRVSLGSTRTLVLRRAHRALLVV